MKAEKFTPTDKQDCIEIFKSNIPDSFSAPELTDFEEWINRNDCTDFYVLKKGGQIIGFGGFYFENRQARLVYGIIHKKYQKKGYGKFMTNYRIEKIRKRDRGIPIGLETTQQTNKYFEKFGFKTVKVIQKYYYNRFDKYEMILQPDTEKENI